MLAHDSQGNLVNVWSGLTVLGLDFDIMVYRGAQDVLTYDRDLTVYSPRIELDANGNVGVVFGEPITIPADLFDSGIDQYLPEIPPQQYVPWQNYATAVDPTWWNTILAVADGANEGATDGAAVWVNSLTFGFACSERADAAQRRAIENGDVITQIGFGAAKVSATATQTLATMGAGGYIAGTRAGVAATNALSKLPCAVKTTGQVGGIAIGGAGTIYSGNAAYQSAQEGDYANMISHGANTLFGALDVFHSARNFGPGCFTAGTQIIVGMEYDADGNFVSYVTANIEDVKVGDHVYSYDTATGEVSQKAVIKTVALESNHINYLTIVDGDGNEQVIETTDVHPFWVLTDDPDFSRGARDYVDENGVVWYHEGLGSTEYGFWVEAKDLCVGDVFMGANGEFSTLTNIVHVEQSGGIAVFNFTVEGNHNYFIIAKDFDYGQTCVLVHNAKKCLIEGDGIKKYTEDGRAIRNGKLAGGVHGSGIPFDKDGFPDFSNVSQKDVKIKFTGDRYLDEIAANKAAGLKNTPEGMTWHHHQDGTTMQLVPQKIHAETGHTGGFGLQ